MELAHDEGNLLVGAINATRILEDEVFGRSVGNEVIILERIDEQDIAKQSLVSGHALLLLMLRSEFGDRFAGIFVENAVSAHFDEGRFDAGRIDGREIVHIDVGHRGHILHHADEIVAFFIGIGIDVELALQGVARPSALME